MIEPSIQQLKNIANLIRYYIIFMTTTAGSGHVTSSLSAVELMTALFFTQFQYDLDNPENPQNDRLIFSKGHASPLFYGLYAATGRLTKDELSLYRTLRSPLEGHPTLQFPYTEAPTGSLGQGLSIGLGEALALKYQSQMGSQHIPKVYVLMGDGEMAEGSVWEAMNIASYYKVNNLIGIIDVNRQGQSQDTMFGHDLDTYVKRCESFGWKTIIVDGHNVEDLVQTYTNISLESTDKPTMIIAKTYKGYGISMLQDKPNWHGKPLPKEKMEEAISELGEIDFTLKGEVKRPGQAVVNEKLKISEYEKGTKSLEYKKGELIATRQAAGDALTAMMSIDSSIVVVDGDVKNSLYTESAQQSYPERYFEMFIAEQNMVGSAIGLQRRGLMPVVTTFSAFLSRAYDQIRMGALAGAHMTFIGSHAGVSIGEDGASQMGLEDISMFRGLLGSNVFAASDAVSAARLLRVAIAHKGISYLRVTRPNLPVLYDAAEEFPVGGMKLHRQIGKNGKKNILIASHGITVFEALSAQKELEKEDIDVIVADCYSIKPLDIEGLQKLVSEENLAHIVVAEDHWSEGGLGDAILNVFAKDTKIQITKLSVTKLPHSGKPAELMEYEEISSKAIIKTIESLISGK